MISKRLVARTLAVPMVVAAMVAKLESAVAVVVVTDVVVNQIIAAENDALIFKRYFIYNLY